MADCRLTIADRPTVADRRPVVPDPLPTVGDGWLMVNGRLLANRYFLVLPVLVLALSVSPPCLGLVLSLSSACSVLVLFLSCPCPCPGVVPATTPFNTQCWFVIDKTK